MSSRNKYYREINVKDNVDITYGAKEKVTVRLSADELRMLDRGVKKHNLKNRSEGPRRGIEYLDTRASPDIYPVILQNCTKSLARC